MVRWFFFHSVVSLLTAGPVWSCGICLQAEVAREIVGLLNVPATGYCISGTGLIRQLYLLPHCDRSCTSNLQTPLDTVYWHWAIQPWHWPSNIRRLARYPLEYRFWSYWYYWSRTYGDSGIPSQVCGPADGPLTIRPPRRWQGRQRVNVLWVLCVKSTSWGFCFASFVFGFVLSCLVSLCFALFRFGFCALFVCV